MTTRKERSTICETCGETDKDKLLVFKPICYTCRNKKYVKPKDPRKEPKIKINIPDGIEDRKAFYKKEYNKISHQQNKESRRERIKFNKRINLLKKYCGLLNRDFNEYLKNGQSDDEIKKINGLLINEYRELKKVTRKAGKPKKVFDQEYHTENFKNKLKEVFGDNITLVGNYTNRHTSIILNCKEHGEFKFTPKKLSEVKYLCPSCRVKTLNSCYIENFKNKIKDRFGDGITLVGDYINQAIKVTLDCKEHGEFDFLPISINDDVKYACPSCRIEHGFAQSEIKQGVIVKGLNNEELIQKSMELYGDKYNYSKFKYISKKQKVIFICKEHGEFEQKYESHIMGFQGCKKCAPHDKTNFSEKMLSHKLYLNLREHISRSLKYLGVEYKKYDTNYSSIKISGLKKEDFLKYLETKMEPWMTWANYGMYNGTPNYGWDLDHVVPRNAVKTMEDFYRVYHHTNIQPLCSYVNRDVKKDKISK
jgi:hypothetical protein